MLVCIHQPNFLPRPKVIDKMIHSDLTIYLDDVQYVPREWQNRALIRKPNGEFYWLSIPVFTKNRRNQLIMECQIIDCNRWRHKHIAAIEHFYVRSPWLNLFKEIIAPLWANSLTELSIFCVESVKYILRTLKRTITTIFSHQLVNNALFSSVLTETLKDFHFLTNHGFHSKYEIRYRRTIRLIALCRAVRGTAYLSGTGALAYLEPDLFKSANIKLFLQHDLDYEGPSWRRLSILDAILMRGPQKTIKDLLRGQYEKF